MEKYMVLCEDGGKNFDCSMFKIYIKEKINNKYYFSYSKKMNKEEYTRFAERNKDNEIRLFVDNYLVDDNMVNIDKRARMNKYNETIFETIVDVRDWLSILKTSKIFGSEEIFTKVSSAINKVRQYPKVKDN